MISHLACQRACRAHLVTLKFGNVTGDNLAASAVGYTASNSPFLARGYAVGMEVTASGFATAGNNGVKRVTAVSANLLTVAGGLTVEAHTNTMRLDLELPALRVWELAALTPNTPPLGTPYVTDRWLPGPVTQTTISTVGFVEATPQYQVLIYGPSGNGMDALASYGDAVLDHFKPGLALTTDAGEVVRVRGDIAPFRTPLVLDTPGWAVVSLSVPLRIEATIN